MNRIDDLKAMIPGIDDLPLDSSYKFCFEQREIALELLSKLEAVEKALDNIIFETDVPASDVPLIRRLSVEALQQLRS